MYVSCFTICITAVSITSFRTNLCVDLFVFDLRATVGADGVDASMLSQMRYEFSYFHASMRYCKHVMLHFMHAVL